MFDHQGAWKDRTAWEVLPCTNPTGWWTVGYYRKGPHHGEWNARHHWADKRDADLHVTVLNRGLDCDAAKALVMACIHSEEPAA